MQSVGAAVLQYRSRPVGHGVDDPSGLWRLAADSYGVRKGAVAVSDLLEVDESVNSADDALPQSSDRSADAMLT